MSGGNKRPYILKQTCSNLNKINANKCTNQNILGEYLPVQTSNINSKTKCEICSKLTKA